jgi:hypothetical protein
MKGIEFTGLMEKAGKYISKNSATILTGLGIAGFVATAVYAVEATPDAVEAIEAAEEDKGEALTKPEVVKAAYRSYIPAVAMGTVSTACIVGAHRIDAKRNMALATLYTLTNENFRDYRAAVTEKLGEKKEHEIEDIFSKHKVEENPVDSNEVIITNGDTLCYDPWSGRYFKSSIEKIRGAVNDINEEINRSLCADLNDFYFSIGLPTVKAGDYAGWNVDHPLSVYFSSQIAENNEPCIVLNFHTEPMANFMEF